MTMTARAAKPRGTRNRGEDMDQTPVRCWSTILTRRTRGEGQGFRIGSSQEIASAPFRTLAADPSPSSLERRRAAAVAPAHHLVRSLPEAIHADFLLGMAPGAG